MSGWERPTTPEVLVLGSVNRDITVVVEDFPEPGETIMGSSVAYGLGGKGANQAVAAALTGVPTSFYGCVGEDATGPELLAELRERGVATDAARVRTGESSGTAHITVDARGENSIAVVPGANAAMTGEVLAGAADAGFLGAAVVVTQGEIPARGIDELAELIQDAEARWVLNLAPAVEVAEQTLATADVLVVNETEAAVLVRRHGLEEFAEAGTTGQAQQGSDAAGVPDGARRAAALTRLAPAVIVTVGAEGSWIAVRPEDADGDADETSADGDEPAGKKGQTNADLPEAVHLDAVPAERVVDTTGAGDAYVGVLAAALARALRDAPPQESIHPAGTAPVITRTLLERCARIAGREAADVVSRPGASSSYRTFSLEES